MKHARWAVAVATAATIATGAASSAVAAESNRVHVALGASSLIYLPVYVAKAKDYFAEEGLDGDIRVLRGGVQALAAVVAGDAEVYVGPPSTAMRAIVKGQDLKVFGAVMNQVPSNIVVQGAAAKARGISADKPLAERIKAMKGLIMGVNAPGSAPDRILRYVLLEYGISPDADLTISPVGGGSALLAAFEQKRIDGFIWSPPTSDIAVDKFGGEMVLRFSSGEFKPLEGFLYLSLISRQDWLDANSERSAKLVKVIARAMKLLHENPEEARAAVRTLFPDMEEGIFNAGFAAHAASIPASPEVTRDDILLAKKFEEETANVKFDLDPDDVFTNRYVEAASKM